MHVPSPLSSSLPAENGASARLRRRRGWPSWLTSAFRTSRIVFRYVLADNARNKRSFGIGAVTVFLVVLFLSLIQNALSRSGVVFLKLAEDQAGSFDLLLLPDLTSSREGTSSATAISFLNYTYINETLQPLVGTEITGTAPRWIFRANVSAAVAATTNNAQDSRGITASIMVMDSMLEDSIGLATQWPYRSLGNQEAHISASLLRALSVQPNKGESIRLEINLDQVFTGLDQLTGTIPGNAFAFNLPPGASNTNNVTTIVVNGQTITLPANSTNPVVFPAPAFNLLPTNIQQSLQETFNFQFVDGSLVVTATTFRSIFGNTSLAVRTSANVIDAIDGTYGKFPASLGNVVVVEKDFLIRALAETIQRFLPPTSTFSESSLRDTVNLDEYVFSTVVVLRDRFATYVKGTTGRQADIVHLSNEVMKALGLEYQVTVLDVLNQALTGIDIVRIFLEEIFFTVVAVLVILAMILITSLLLSDAEEKTFEYAILRTLGLPQKYLILLLVLQSLLFSIPGVTVGLMTCYVAFVPIGYFLAMFSGSNVDVSIDSSALILGVVLGVALPLFGMSIPIRRALTKTIRDALDVYHNVVFDTAASIQKLEDIGLSVTETTVSILLVVGGFLVYYVIPLSFIFNRFDLFFRIMTVILLSMVIGQLLLGQIFQPFLQQVAVRIATFVSSDSNISQVIQKNLLGHSGRNRKTSIMFTLCLGYLIFAATMFQLQSNSFSQQLEWSNGADISVDAPTYELPLPEDMLRNYLNSMRANTTIQDPLPRIVVDFTFMTFPLNSYFPVQGCEIARIVNVRATNIQVFAVEQNFLSVTFNRYFIPSELNKQLRFDTLPSGVVDVIAPLYRNMSMPPSQIPKSVLYVPASDTAAQQAVKMRQQHGYRQKVPILLSESLRDRFSIDAQELLFFYMDYWADATNTWVEEFLVQPVAMIRKMPAFPTFSRLRTSNTPTIISMEWFQYLLGVLDKTGWANVLAYSGTTLPKGTLLIRVSEYATPLQIEALINQINSLLANDKYVVTDLRAQVATTQAASDFIDIVFSIVAFVGILLSFFVLLLSFIANIRENSWELGVLRAIGLSVTAVSRIYIYEALSIIFGCIVIGSALGIFTAVTLTLQFNLFTEMPFEFYFPGGLFALISIFSAAVAVVGSYYPTIAFNKKPIAIVLRGG